MLLLCKFNNFSPSFECNEFNSKTFLQKKFISVTALVKKLCWNSHTRTILCYMCILFSLPVVLVYFWCSLWKSLVSIRTMLLHSGTGLVDGIAVSDLLVLVPSFHRLTFDWYFWFQFVVLLGCCLYLSSTVSQLLKSM